jgi:hypothetical protein
MVTINHAFTCGISDDPTQAAAGQVVPSNWNAAHSIVGGTAGAHFYLDTNQTLSMVRLPGFLFGLTLSTAGSSTTFSVAAGTAADSGSNNDFMVLTSSLNKTTGAWAVGSGGGSLDTGAIAASTWYHVYLIKRPDTLVVDVLVSASATAPTMPANYTLFRRIGSMRTDGSSNWVAFVQRGDEFLWVTTVIDVNGLALQTANRALYSLTVPLGLQVNALFRATITGSSVTTLVLFTSLDESDQVGGTSGGGLSMINEVVSQYGAGHYNVRTNTSAQIGARSNISGGTFYVYTYGWIDARGRLY